METQLTGHSKEEAASKACRVCGEAIPIAAVKCRHCGSFQNWRRFLDVGQGTIALLVALISVSTLAAETGVRAFNSLFVDPLSPVVRGKVLSLSLDEVQLIFSNNGSSRIFLSQGALCRLPMLKDGVSLIEDSLTLVRHPRRDEVEAIYSVLYSAGGDGQFLEPNSAIRITAKRTSVFREEGLPLKADAVEVRPYCSVDWLGQNAGQDGDFWAVPVVDIGSASDRLRSYPFGETINARAGESEQGPLGSPDDSGAKN